MNNQPATCRRSRYCCSRHSDAPYPLGPRSEDTQTLRFIAEAELRAFDPLWTTAYILRNHGYLVYDTLFGTDENFQIKPQMVERTVVSTDGMKYTFTLRDGLNWHDGRSVLAENCVESLKRWGKRDRFGQLLMAHTAKLLPLDNKTFTLELAERFSPVLDALGKPSSMVPFIMPAWIAATSADELINRFALQRRDLIALVGIAVAFRWERASAAPAKVGVLGPAPPPVLAAMSDAVANVLGSRGLIRGRDFVFDLRSAEGKPERLPGLAREMVADGVGVIFTRSYPAARAAKDATSTILIVIKYRRAGRNPAGSEPR